VKIRILYCWLFWLILCLGEVKAQQKGFDYRAEAQKLHANIDAKFYDPKAQLYTDNQSSEHRFSELWGLCCMLQVANELEKAQLNQQYISKILAIIEQYYSERAGIAGYDSYLVKYGGGDRYYDDNQWIGIALMDAHARTHKKEYLQKSEMIYRFMMTGYDQAVGGGIYWREVDKITKNTCSNAPGIILALQLYKATSQQNYLTDALKIYDWTNKKLRSPEGLFYDNVVVKNDSIDTRKYSYNTGAMLQANVYLYEITKQKKYLNEAKIIAQAAQKHFYSKVYFIDDYWFNAVMLRALEHFSTLFPKKNQVKSFKKCIDFALKNDQNSKGLMGKQKTLGLVNQAGMLEILLRIKP
jgi:rhamnogalacturonyl hydrolase YesR